MKIKKILLKNSIFQNILSVLCYIYVILVSLTSKIIHKNQETPFYYWKNEKPFILAFWHSQLLMITYSWFSKKKLNIEQPGKKHIDLFYFHQSDKIYNKQYKT